MDTRFTDLVGCEVPIQLAGMGWVASPELALAVTAAGGAGTIAPHMVPAAALEPMLEDLAARSNGPIGFNVLMPFLDVEAVEAAARHLRYVEFFYGDPDRGLVERVHGQGALAAWQVGSAQEASAAVDAGCDFVIAQGVEAGGHVRGTTALLPLLDAVLNVVATPVVAAGGIATPRALAAVLAAGADGARVGSRFIATPEADAHTDYVAALLASDGTDTVVTETFSTMWPDAPHRVLRSCIDAARRGTDEMVGSVQMGGAEIPLPRFAPMAPVRATTGDIAAMPLYAGEGIGAIQEIRPAGDIVRELADGAAQLLERRQGVG